MQSPLRITTSGEMRELDLIADRDYQLDAATLMENAGRSAAQIILQKCPKAGIDTEILVFAGKGNNAGDGFVLARHLLCHERRVRVFHLETEAGYRNATLKNFQILKKMRAKMVHLEASGDLQAFFSSSPGNFTVIDAILGTGLTRSIEGIFYEVVEMINALEAVEVIALDIPTGVSGDTGAILGASVQATMTISFGFPKLGHFLPPGASRRGELVNVDISLPPRFRREGDKFLLRKSPMGMLMKERDRYGHKNSFGHTLLIGGSPGRIGAIVMAARACHKMGTGLVTVAGWDDCFETLMLKLPSETMVVPLRLQGPEYEIYKKNLPSYSSIVIGPGMGLRPEGKQLVTEVLSNYDGPVVVDADALNMIADYKLHELMVKRKAPTVLTPHPGEMTRLLGWAKEEVVQDPVRAIKKAVQETHAIVLLKGAATLIASPDDVLYLNHYPNDGMATAGSGDVLAGMIGGLIGQRMDPFQGTLLGVYLHSLAGDFAASEHGHRSMTAPDIIENIGNAIKDLKATQEQPSVEDHAWLL
ncbi:MAG TPA: NAD(P)H-hydrate dehydratase [Bdellovibrionota bacterium]|nr:NAD(P)H-hydrate dehydratase [Bdellovibrionota bacterium]